MFFKEMLTFYSEIHTKATNKNTGLPIAKISV
jgi:hypothetical protein